MNYLLQFGSYVLPTTLRPDDPFAESFDLGEQERPRASGATSQIGRKQSRSLPVRGELSAADPTTLTALIDAIKASLIGVQNLYYGRDDRYHVAQLESVTGTCKDGRTWGTFFSVSLNFKASDPDAYDAAGVNTTTLSLPSGTVTNAGTSQSLPLWTLTIGTAGTGTVTLANATTGETATIAGTFASGDVIALNRAGYGVTWNGAAAYGLFDGRIPVLAAGANAVSVTAATITVASATVAYTNRYQ
jgi:hypothetical protein